MAENSDGKIESLGRADPPSSWRHTTGHEPDIDMTWHHVIPLRCLNTVWNGLVEGGHWEAAQRFLHVAGARDPAGMMALMKEGALKGEHRDKVHEHVTWQGWNIVEGPGGACRVDDPRDEFETFHWTTLSSNQRSTMLAVTSLYTKMEPLQRQLGGRDARPISDEQAAQFSKTLSDSQSVLRNRAPIPFNRKMWTEVDSGRTGKRKPSYRKAHP